MLWGFAVRVSGTRALKQSGLIKKQSQLFFWGISIFPQSGSHCAKTLFFDGAAAYG